MNYKKKLFVIRIIELLNIRIRINELTNYKNNYSFYSIRLCTRAALGLRLALTRVPALDAGRFCIRLIPKFV